MQKPSNYANYFQRATSLMRKNKDIMVAIYSKFPFLGQPYRFLQRGVPDDATILDAGAGQGNYLLIARNLKPRAAFHACDLENALVHESLENIPFACCDMDARPLPYPDNYFDHINSMHVLEHLHNPLHFLLECKRALKPGGTLHIEVPDVRLTLVPHIPFITSAEGVFNFWDDPTHLRPYSRPSLTKLARMASFAEIIDCFYVHRWAHLLVLPLALVTRDNEYKTALFHALGLFCGIIVRK
jgi:2-polyprenyl-3-methyl-5-hydroxy-6-metoxy-1,4-benzoquinol methylase